MAQRRMFNKIVTNNDKFIEMPDSAQNLYFHLSMNADDDGFVDNWKSIMRMTGHKEDDLKVLIAKQYIIPFESGVIVIKHWRLNNYLRNDRFTPSNYKKELETLKLDENLVYQVATSGIPLGNPDKIRLDKNRIEEIRLEENRIEENSNKPKASFDQMQQVYNDTCSNLASCKIKTDARVKAVNTFNKQFTDALDTWKEICVMANNNKFLCGVNNSKEHKNWKATFDWLINVNNATKVLEGKYDENELSNMSRGLQVLSEIESEVE